MSRFVDAQPSSPRLHFLLHFEVFYLFDFLEKVVGPGLKGRHVAKPVT